MDVLNFGLTLTWVAAVTTALVWVLSVLAISTKDRRLVVSARSGFYVTFFLLLGASATLVYGFIAGVYNNEYIVFHPYQVFRRGPVAAPPVPSRPADAPRTPAPQTRWRRRQMYRRGRTARAAARPPRTPPPSSGA